MSYISAKGKAAAESATAENTKKDYSESLVKLKSGDTKFVKLPDAESFVEYLAASIFKVFYTTPVEPGNNLYEKAAKALFAKGDEASTEAARAINPKPRYLFGFIDLDSGKPVVVDFTKNQAKVLIAAIEKYAKKVDKVAFELSKTGKSTETVVSLTPVLDMDEDLTETQRKHFDEAVKSGAKVEDEIYENVLYVKKPEEQAEDLHAFAQKFGVDLAELGVDVGGNETEKGEDPTGVF